MSGSSESGLERGSECGRLRRALGRRRICGRGDQGFAILVKNYGFHRSNYEFRN
jgi:hypothetical protein